MTRRISAEGLAAGGLPLDWTPNVPMARIVFHWTAGAYTANATDRRAYHFIVESDGGVVRGDPDIALNSGTLKPGYAAHTRSLNTNSIGISLACMGGAQEAPLDAGRWPMLPAQIDTLVALCRILGERYAIPVTRRTMLSHAEVQPTLGVTQSGKWDFTRIPFLPELRGGHAIGDMIRARIGEPPAMTLPMPAGAIGVVTVSSLNARNAPNGDVTGSLPKGTCVEVVGQQGVWLRVVTPAGFSVWVHGDHVEAVDGPPPMAPTTPDPRRVMLAKIRAALDEIEATL